ncbi:unnamed protein product [Polarella glacialis]|uniref:Uncharacterized protein n=1 Tax=Polarella glacialis TaxID=89957 RepID=A0A813LB44_POLGL|nr:unnamed protein product [Polarella glacialis]
MMNVFVWLFHAWLFVHTALFSLVFPFIHRFWCYSGAGSRGFFMHPILFKRRCFLWLFHASLVLQAALFPVAFPSPLICVKPRSPAHTLYAQHGHNVCTLIEATKMHRGCDRRSTQ